MAERLKVLAIGGIVATCLVLLMGMLGASVGSAATHTVAATAFSTFSPSTLTIGVGDTVSWTGVTGAHTVTADTSNAPWTRSTEDFSVTFSSAGTFPYHCEVHPGMTGQIVVQAPSTPSATATFAVPTQAPQASRSFVPIGGRTGGLASGDVAVYPGTFAPKTLTIASGATVRWVDQGTSHTVTSDPGNAADLPTFDSGTLTPGDEFAFTFTVPGTYAYYCTFHGAPGGVGHSGTIVVQ